MEISTASYIPLRRAPGDASVAWELLNESNSVTSVVSPEDKVHVARRTYARGNLDNRKFGRLSWWQLSNRE